MYGEPIKYTTWFTVFYSKKLKNKDEWKSRWGTPLMRPNPQAKREEEKNIWKRWNWEILKDKRHKEHSINFFRHQLSHQFGFFVISRWLLRFFFVVNSLFATTCLPWNKQNLCQKRVNWTAFFVCVLNLSLNWWNSSTSIFFDRLCFSLRLSFSLSPVRLVDPAASGSSI